MADDRETGFELPIHIDYFPPGWLAGIVALVHLGAILCVLPTSLELYAKFLLILTIILSFVMTEYRLYRRMNDTNPLQLVLDQEDRWYVIDSALSRKRVVLKSGGFINPILAILRFMDNKKTRYVFILSSSNVNADTLRRLRVRMKFRKTPG